MNKKTLYSGKILAHRMADKTEYYLYGKKNYTNDWYAYNPKIRN